MTKYIINPITGRKVLKNGRIGIKIMKGGGLIGTGSYGEVYYPAIRCTNRYTRTNPLNKEDKNRYNYVTKVYKNPNAEKYRNEEGQEFNKVKAINLDGKFHIPKEYNCIDNITRRPASVFKYGGVTLDKIKEKDINKIVISKLRTLFEGLFIMGKNNYLHFDIKQNNIVYSEKNGFKFIDFGFMFQPFTDNKMDKYTINMRIRNEYFVWPWDIQYYYHYIKRERLPYPFKTFINKKSYNYKDNGNFHNSSLNDEKISELNKLINKNHSKSKEYCERLMKTVDVYSLGVTLRRTPNIYNKMGKETKKLIELMIHDDAFERPLPEDALRMFDDAILKDYHINLVAPREQYRALGEPYRAPVLNPIRLQAPLAPREQLTLEKLEKQVEQLAPYIKPRTQGIINRARAAQTRRRLQEVLKKLQKLVEQVKPYIKPRVHEIINRARAELARAQEPAQAARARAQSQARAQAQVEQLRRKLEKLKLK